MIKAKTPTDVIEVAWDRAGYAEKGKDHIGITVMVLVIYFIKSTEGTTYSLSKIVQRSRLPSACLSVIIIALMTI